jgi:Rrf2 family protein
LIQGSDGQSRLVTIDRSRHVFSQSAEYALRATIHIAQRGGGPEVVQDIAAATCVPAGYLAKVLRLLVKPGILQAQRGIGGGFALARPASDISVLDILRATDDVRRIHECPLGISDHTSLCKLHQLLDEVIRCAEEKCGAASLDDILKAGNSQPLCDAPPPPTSIRIDRPDGA